MFDINSIPNIDIASCTYNIAGSLCLPSGCGLLVCGLFWCFTWFLAGFLGAVGWLLVCFSLLTVGSRCLFYSCFLPGFSAWGGPFCLLGWVCVACRLLGCCCLLVWGGRLIAGVFLLCLGSLVVLGAHLVLGYLRAFALCFFFCGGVGCLFCLYLGLKLNAFLCYVSGLVFVLYCAYFLVVR